MSHGESNEVLVINTLPQLHNLLKQNSESKHVHIFTLSTVNDLRKVMQTFPSTKLSLIVIIGELLHDNTEMIKSTNFTVSDFVYSFIHSIQFDYVHIDIPMIQPKQREIIINLLTKTSTFSKSQFGISINRSSSIDLTNTANFAKDVAKIGQPSKNILNYCRNFLILTSSGSHHNTPISSLSTDDGSLAFDQTLYSTLTNKILITEQSLGMYDDEIASFDSVYMVSDLTTILDLMKLPWESKLGNERSTILHITIFLPFLNDGDTTYLEMPDKTRIPMSFFEDLQKKAQQKRTSRFFFPLIHTIGQPELQNEKVFILKVKKRLKIVQQILFTSKWVTWKDAFKKVSPSLYSRSQGEKIRAISPIYDKNENNVVVFQNAYSVVSDFNPHSLIPFHQSNVVFCEIFQADRPVSLPVKRKAPELITIKPQEKHQKINHTDELNEDENVDEFFTQLTNTKTLSIQLT